MTKTSTRLTKYPHLVNQGGWLTNLSLVDQGGGGSTKPTLAPWSTPPKVDQGSRTLVDQGGWLTYLPLVDQTRGWSIHVWLVNLRSGLNQRIWVNPREHLKVFLQQSVTTIHTRASDFIGHVQLNALEKRRHRVFHFWRFPLVSSTAFFGLKLEHWRFQSITNRFRSIDLLKDDPLLKLGVNFGRHLLELGNSARGSVGYKASEWSTNQPGSSNQPGSTHVRGLRTPPWLTNPLGYPRGGWLIQSLGWVG